MKYRIITKDTKFYFHGARDYNSIEEAWKAELGRTSYTLVGIIAVADSPDVPLIRPEYDKWVEANKHKLYTGETRIVVEIAPITPGPRKPKPQVCPEVWATPNPNVDYMAAVRAMCGDSK